MEEEVSQSEKQETKTKTNPFGSNLGRLLEIGFNTGLLDALQSREKVKTYFGETYKKDLGELYAPKLIATFVELSKVISPWDKENSQLWAYYMLIRGYLGGVTFLPEYLNSFSSHMPEAIRTIIYLQCNFYGENSLGTHPRNERSANTEALQQFPHAGYPLDFTEADMRKYRGQGEFLKADTLLLLKYGKTWRILCIDLSIFSVREPKDAGDLNDIDFFRSMIAKEVGYQRSKSVFTNLSIDTDAQATEDIVLSEQLRRYFTAFKRKDKESAKVIQAASYAWSFYQFLLQKGILDENSDILINAIGYSDRGWSGFAVKRGQTHLLQTCSAIYQNQSSDQNIDKARDAVLGAIEKASHNSFQGIAPRTGKDFIKDLVHLADSGDGIHWVRHEEVLDRFVSTLTPVQDTHLNGTAQQWLQDKEYLNQPLREVHAMLIHKALSLQDLYLFLTGSPGIGKTTALVNFLKEAITKGEGFLLLYVSPRKEVNIDIIKKFREPTGLPPCQEIFALTANSIIIHNNNSQKTVHYFSPKRQDRFQRSNVTFIPTDSEEAHQQNQAQQDLEELQEGLFIGQPAKASGVLNSLCSGLNIILENDLARAIVATAAIQSLKRIGDANDTTLRHLHTIFASVCDKKGKIIDMKMKELRKRIKHIFIMIDEVTGDESGAAFLAGIHQFLINKQLVNSPYGFNTKIIVADASVVNPRVIKQHLEQVNYEPDKVYVRKVNREERCEALSVQEIRFKLKRAIVINANAYPADRLRLHYRVGIDTLKYDEKEYTERRTNISKTMNEEIIEYAMNTLATPNAPQLLIYIQDKQRLARIIQEIYRRRSGHFKLYQEYLEIHANISENTRNMIGDCRKTVPIVFMTASASRGLSFPKARHILVDIPHFEIEQNLMEILQVMYRGRGEDAQDCGEKQITFYLTDTIAYDTDQDRALSVREKMMHLLNVLLILKTSIMTRIQGYGHIGWKRYMMVPVGGKAVGGAGETFTSKIGNLIKQLQDQEHLNWDDKRLSYVRTNLQQILGKVQITLSGQETPQWVQIGDKKRRRRPFVPMLPTFFAEFMDHVRTGFSYLLDWEAWEDAYISGSMLIAPVVGRSMQETYWLQVEKMLCEEKQDGRLEACMEELRRDGRYSQNLHTALYEGGILLRAVKSYDGHKWQKYEQESTYPDQHCAFPVVSFLAYPAMVDYFSTKPESEEKLESAFRTLLLSYIRRFCSADSVLPLGRQYEEFPFLIFRSASLKEARSKIFTGNYLFMSHEMNILNMMLSAAEEKSQEDGKQK